MKIEIYDPPMCCSTGLCGPSVDPELVRFAADLDWLKRQGVMVERYNLSQQPAAFAGNPLVKEALAKEGNDCLPLTMVDGALVLRSRYPTREMLADYARIKISPSILTDAVKELVAIAAAIGSSGEISFGQHYMEALKLGVSQDDVRLAVKMAQSVKDRTALSIWELAHKYLSEPGTEGKPDNCSCC